MKFHKLGASFTRILKNNIRNLCMASSNSSLPREISVPTSYGHIAGKVWGSEDGKKVLALHGWQDSCASFDTLIPLLPNNLRIAAIDFAGHGFSSHKPLGASYNFLDQLIDIKSVARYFNWDKFSIMGHSMGGATGIFYASCFPEEIEGLVTLDGMDADIIPSYKYPARTAQLVNMFFSTHEKLTRPPSVYSYDDAFKRLQEDQKEFMTSVGVEYLMNRAVKPVETDPNSFIISRDLRVQAMNFQPASAELHFQFFHLYNLGSR